MTSAKTEDKAGLSAEMKDELKALEEARNLLATLGAGECQADDAVLQMSILLMLATRLQRLNYQLDNLIAAIRK